MCRSGHKQLVARKFRSSKRGMGKWTVVWCAEGSLTPERHTLRDWLVCQAHEHGAEFLCLRKACHFERWSSLTTKPYVLFSDWREVKHCVATVTGRGLEGRPMFTSVFCVDATQQTRAKRWSVSLAERQDPIHIHGDLSSSQSTVATLLSQVPEALGKIQMQSTKLVEGSVQGKLKLEQLEPVLPLCELTEPEDGIQTNMWSEHGHPKYGDVLGNTVLNGPDIQVVQIPMNLPAQAAVFVAPCVSHEKHSFHPTVAAHVGQFWTSFSSYEDVASALLSAMPEGYEE